MSIEIISLTVFVALALLTVGVASLVSERRGAASRRLIDVTTATSADPFRARREEEERSSGGLRFAAELVEKVGFWSEAKFETDKIEAKTDTIQTLSFAGWRSPRAVAFFKGARVIGAIALMLVAVTAARFVESASFSPWSAGIFAGLIGFYGPKLYLNMKIRRRQLTIIKSLPDVLDMLIICVQAGLGLNAALDRVARERTRIGNDVALE